jgi:DNA-binding MarR family transcriptional regulator
MTESVVDLGAAKALANPLRQRILRELRAMGEATSTTLAERLGVTTGGTSYNLRVLAEHGFVEEIPDRAHGRERWWRLVERSLRLPRQSEQSPELRTALDTLNQLWLDEDLVTFARFQEQRPGMGEWADALPYSRGTVRVNLTELESFFEDYLALLRRYQPPDDQAAADSRVVLTRFIAFPGPD